MKHIIVILPFLLLAGCQTTPPAPTVDLSAMQTRMSELQERATRAEVALDAQAMAQETLDASESERLGKLKVNVVAAHGAVDDDNKPVAQGELTVAEARLIDVRPDPEEQVAAAQRKQLVAEGRMQEAQTAYGVATKDAQDKATQIGVLTTERDSAKAEAEQARREATDALAATASAQADVEAQIADAKAQEAARILADIRAKEVNAALWAGGICGIAALGCIAGMIFLSAAAKMFGRGAATAGVLCMVCFGFARFLGSPWFDLAWKVTAGTLAVGGVAWVAWEIRTAIKRREAEKVAADNAMVAEKIIPVLDNYYKHVASPEAVADMDKTGGLWDSLDDLGGAYDAAVKRIKAAQAENTVAQIKKSIITEATLPCEP
jgi:hypothetical protein